MDVVTSFNELAHACHSPIGDPTDGSVGEDEALAAVLTRLTVDKASTPSSNESLDTTLVFVKSVSNFRLVHMLI